MAPLLPANARARGGRRRALGLVAAAAAALGLVALAAVLLQPLRLRAPALLAWDPKHPAPEQRKIMREMQSEIARGGKATPADKATIAGLEHRVEALKAVAPAAKAGKLAGLGGRVGENIDINDLILQGADAGKDAVSAAAPAMAGGALLPLPTAAAPLTADKALFKDTLEQDAELAEQPDMSRADRALADADSVLDGAPDVVKRVVQASAAQPRAEAAASAADALDKEVQAAYADSLAGGQKLAKGANALDTIDDEAHEAYKDSLEGYERLEEGMAPKEPAEHLARAERRAEQRAKLEADAKRERQVLSKRFKAPGTAQQLQKTDPAVVQQMMWDLKHPPAEERKMEREMEREIASPGKADAASKKLVAGLERKVESLEALNGKLALTKAPPGTASQAMQHAEQVAAKAARSEEKKALAATTSLVPKGPVSPALRHAEAVAKKAALAEVKKEELATKKFMKKKVKVDKLKLLGVREDRLGGVRKALVAGQKTAKKIPGVKEDTWPFAPGSFHYARKHPLPGVNEASWEIIPDFEGPKRAAKGFKDRAGGCFPDGKGGLKCHGEQEPWMKKVKGWDKKGSLPKRAAGTGLATLLPHIREDAKQQKLEAAAEAFGDAMAQPDPARTADLLVKGAKNARLQSLEQVAKQCSTFLDCLSMQGSVMPQYTHPTYGAKDDRIVRTQAQSLSHTAMHDAFNPELRPWRLVSKWPFESGDVAVKMPKDWIGKIARPSVSSHHKSHMKYDVPAAELPSSTLSTMYARERKELRGQALAAEKSGTLPQLMSLWEEESSVPARQGRLKAQMLAVEANPKPEPKNNPVMPGARGLGVRNYENTVGLCTKGINCDSSNWPFGEPDSMSDALVDAQQVQNGGLGMSGPWTPMMYTGNKPTSYDPGAAYIPDYQFLANRRRSQGFPETKAQMLRLEQAQPQMMEEEEEAPAVGEEAGAEEEEEGPVECPVCETCAEDDEECIEANADCMAAAEECNAAAMAAKCGECEDGDEECEQEKEACEAEAACLEGDNECIAAARGGFWSPMTGHIEKNAKEFEHMPRPQHHGAHKWHLPGVNVDSGWMPYKHADVWGYDRRPSARSPDPEEGGEDEAVHPTSHTGLLSASQDLPKEQWGSMDRIEHSDHNRAIGSLKHAWHSVAGGEEESTQAEAEAAEAADEHAEEAAAEGGAGGAGAEAEPAYDWEKGPMYDADGGEEMSTEAKMKLFKEAPSLRMQEAQDGQGLRLEREADAERAHAAQEQQQLDQFLHARFGVGMKEEGGGDGKAQELAQVRGAGRKLLSSDQDDPNVEPKHDDTLNGKWPVRPPPPDGDDDPVLPRRARGKGKHARGKGGELAKGGQKGRVREPNKDKMVLDLRKVRSEANKLDEGPWSLSAAMDRAVQSTARKATDDIRALVGLGKIHVKHAEHGKSAKTGAEVAPPAMETGANAQHSQLEDLNALTADVDEVFRNDDLSDMSGVDAKLHQLVNNMRQRRAGRGTH